MAAGRGGGAGPLDCDRGLARVAAGLPGRRPGTNAHNDVYLAGKRRVVEHFGHSSFYERRRYEADGIDASRPRPRSGSPSTRPMAAACR